MASRGCIGAAPVLQVGEQRAAVARPVSGSVVASRRLVASILRVVAKVLARRASTARREATPRTTATGADRGQVADREQGDDRRASRPGHDRASRPLLATVAGAPRQPGRGREQQEGERPADAGEVERLGRLPGDGEVDDVGGTEEQQGRPISGQVPAGSPARWW